jgi:hypothetical protein
MRERVNIFGKHGFLTKEERARDLERRLEYSTVKTNIDLSKGVIFTPFGSSREITQQQYSYDLASFMLWWGEFISCDLNGFNLYHVKFGVSGKLLP